MMAGVHRALADDGSAFLFCDRRYLARLLIAAGDVGFHHHDLIVWRYRFGVYQGRRLTNSWCPIAWLAKTRRPFFDADAVRVKSVRQPWATAGPTPLGRIDGNARLDHRVAGSHAERTAGVRTQLPLKLVRRLVRMSTRPDDVVLGTFAGSATSVVAAIETGRRGVGVEPSRARGSPPTPRPSASRRRWPRPAGGIPG
jgi:DNA modification methylase